MTQPYQWPLPTWAGGPNIFVQATTIVVDPIHGNDLYPVGPFQTIAKLNTFMANALILAAVTISIVSDVPASDAALGFTFTCPKVNGGSVTVTGVPVVLASGTLTTATESLFPNTNRRTVLGDTVLGANNGWATYLGKQIICTSGAHTGTHATIAPTQSAVNTGALLGRLPGIVTVTNGSANISFFKNPIEPAVTVPQTLAAGTVVQFDAQPGTNYTIQNDVIGGTTAVLTTPYTGTSDSTHYTQVMTGSCTNCSQPITTGGYSNVAGGVLSNGDAYNIQRGVNVQLGRFQVLTDSSTPVLTFQNLTCVARPDTFSAVLEYGVYLFQQCQFPNRIYGLLATVQCQDCYVGGGATMPLSILTVDAGIFVATTTLTTADSGQHIHLSANAYVTGSSIFVAPGLGHWELMSMSKNLSGAQGAQFQDCNDGTGLAALVFHTVSIGLGATFANFGNTGQGGGKAWGNGNLGSGITLYYGGKIAITSTTAFLPTVTGQTSDVQWDNVHTGGFGTSAYAWDTTASPPSYTTIRQFTWVLWIASIAGGGFNYHAHKPDIGAEIIGI